MAKRFGTNPAGADEFEKFQKKDDGARFRVEHSMVGRLPEGTVARAADFGPGADLDRLIGLKAIRPIHGGRDAVEAAGADGDGLVAEVMAEPDRAPDVPKSMRPDPKDVVKAR